MPSDYKAMIDAMTLEEKASLLSGADFWRSRAIERLNIPPMAFADGPHGLRKQASEGDHLGLVKGVEATCFPTSATLANSWDVDICDQVGQAIGKEAVFNSVNILLGPGLNVKRSPLCGRNFEYFSEDPYLSGKLAAAFTKGFQKQGVGACLKHFAANSQEFLRMTNDSIVDARTLHEIYLTGFEIAVKEAKPKAVMSSYNKINGVYAHENPYLLKTILVDQWGFDGIVVSDWGGSNDAVASAKAGATIEMPSTGYDSIHQLVDAVKCGALDESVIDERVQVYLKVLDETKIAQTHEHKSEYKSEYKSEHKPVPNLDAHHLLAQKTAEASIVLLKNEKVLPLSASCKVAIIGDFAKNPRYQGAGSSMVNPYALDHTLSVLDQIPLDVIGYADGFERNGQLNKAKIDEAVALSQQAEVVLLYIGLNEVDEVEGQDRSHLKLPLNQIALIESLAKSKAKIVAIISCGSVIEMPWATACDAIVHGYLSGQAGAKAILNVITGKVNPSGKLTESYPLCYEDTPNAAYYPGTEATSEYREGLYVGYRYYDKAKQAVQFPFGFGLSYTTFEYSELEISLSSAKCKITNIGSLAGGEVVQLYVGKDQDRIHRAVKELKGFAKIFLEPGESAVVEIPFDDYTFRYYDVEKSGFAVEMGTYHIHIARSSKEICLSGQIFVEGVFPQREDSTILSNYFEGNVKNISRETFERLYGKPIPNAFWDRTKPLGLNDSLAQMTYAKSFMARTVIRILCSLRNRSVKKGTPDLNLFFLSNMPFRAVAKMSNGAFSIEMTKSVLMIVNGHFFKGVGNLIQSTIQYRKRGSK